MGKVSKFKPQRDAAASNFSTSMNDAAVAMYEKKVVDNSPQLELEMMDQLLEQCSALNLGTLAAQFTIRCNKFPLFIELNASSASFAIKRGLLMAAAFEAGRRYAILTLTNMMLEEVDVLPSQATQTAEKPVLEQ